MILFIVGNGFDIGNGMRTEYKQFYHFLKNTHEEFFYSVASLFLAEYETDRLWSEFEECLSSFTPDYFINNNFNWQKTSESVLDFQETLASLLKNKNNKIIICENCKSIIGFGSVRIFDKSYETQVKCMCIDNLFVCCNYRGNGIGTNMFNTMKEIAVENNCQKIDLSVWSFDGSAKNFYRKQGMIEQRIYYEMNIQV